MSNALSIPAAIARAAATTRAGAHFTPHQAEVLTTIVAMGILVLVAWAFIRIIHPQKFALVRSPGRPNSLNVAHAAAPLVAWLLVIAVADYLFKGLHAYQRLALTMLIGQCVWLGASLGAGASAFSGGLPRGMGTSLRHWIYDTLRGITGYLAAMPICIGLLHLSLTVVPGKPHSALVQLSGAPLLWKALIVFCVVVMAPLSEEVFFRGLVQSLLRKSLRSPWLAVLVTSGLFGVLHWQTPQNVASLSALGIVLGYNYERTGRLLPAVLIHAIFNAVFISLALWPG